MEPIPQICPINVSGGREEPGLEEGVRGGEVRTKPKGRGRQKWG